jgi:hypothetical protein
MQTGDEAADWQPILFGTHEPRKGWGLPQRRREMVLPPSGDPPNLSENLVIAPLTDLVARMRRQECEVALSKLPDTEDPDFEVYRIVVRFPRKKPARPRRKARAAGKTAWPRR